MDARAGFEPTYTEPKSAVLPLDDQAIKMVPFLGSAPSPRALQAHASTKLA